MLETGQPPSVRFWTWPSGFLSRRAGTHVLTVLSLYCLTCRHRFIATVPGIVVRVKGRSRVLPPRGSRRGGTPLPPITCPRCAGRRLYRPERL